MFITFEGIEGCGKTTQANLLVEYLKKNNIPCIKTLEPGGTDIGQDIRKILLDSKNTHLAPLTELILYAADRAQHVSQIIGPALDQGKWVICDRFFDATVAYQGFGRGMNMELIDFLNLQATAGVSPDLTILMDCPEDIGLKRALDRNKIQNLEDQGRFEKEKIEFHRKVRGGYLKIAEKSRERFRIIDASRSVDEVKQEIENLMASYI
ncbi:MAG: dTMP kinase [Deltaproteobacteria bacterium]|nr:dTMP kinase [Deltaproteobacteria bacterium]